MKAYHLPEKKVPFNKKHERYLQKHELRVVDRDKGWNACRDDAKPVKVDVEKLAKTMHNEYFAHPWEEEDSIGKRLWMNVAKKIATAIEQGEIFKGADNGQT